MNSNFISLSQTTNYKVGLYIRVITEEQAMKIEGSLDSQRHRLNTFVEAKNFQNNDWGGRNSLLGLFRDL